MVHVNKKHSTGGKEKSVKQHRTIGNTGYFTEENVDGAIQTGWLLICNPVFSGSFGAVQGIVGLVDQILFFCHLQTV